MSNSLSVAKNLGVSGYEIALQEINKKCSKWQIIRV